MENIIKPNKGIKRSTFYKTQALLLLIIALIFAIFYILNVKPNVAPSQFLPGPPQAPEFSHMIYGGFGTAQLNKPMAVSAVGEKVFVSDTNNFRVQIFTREGTPIKMFGERGRGKGQFLFPYGLAGDSKGRLLVADLYTGKISVFDQEGNFIEYFGAKQGIDKFLESPSDIKYVNNRLYVADVKKNRVFVFDDNGKMVLEVGKKHNELGAPNGVAVNSKNGDIYVVDTKHSRVVLYDKKGEFLGQLNSTKDKPNDDIFSNPRGIGIDSRDVFYVVNAMVHTVHGFDQEANELFKFGGMGSDVGKFVLPNGLFIDDLGYVYITDTQNNRVAVYR